MVRSTTRYGPGHHSLFLILAVTLSMASVDWTSKVMVFPVRLWERKTGDKR